MRLVEYFEMFGWLLYHHGVVSPYFNYKSHYWISWNVKFTLCH